MLKNTKQEQNGRSMVEMLGVLAVIGVLSIAGIAGYNMAINKHQANEILSAASQRAMVVSAQIQSGKTDPSLDEFTDNSVGGVTFDSSVLKADGGTWATGQSQFSIKISSTVDKDVCKQIYNLAGTSGSIRAIYSGNTKLTADSGCTAATMRFVYNNDLSTTDPTPTSTYPIIPEDQWPAADTVDQDCIDNLGEHYCRCSAAYAVNDYCGYMLICQEESFDNFTCDENWICNSDFAGTSDFDCSQWVGYTG